jgi:GNAT superfamily N-acetyltransferase
MLSLLDLELGVWVKFAETGNMCSSGSFAERTVMPFTSFFTKGLSPTSRKLYSAQPLDRNLVDIIVSEVDAPDVLRLVAFHGEHIVGYAYWRQQLFNPKVPLLSIAIADSHQGLGLGQAMMELLIEGAKTEGNGRD